MSLLHECGHISAFGFGHDDCMVRPYCAFTMFPDAEFIDAFSDSILREECWWW